LALTYEVEPYLSLVDCLQFIHFIKLVLLNYLSFDGHFPVDYVLDNTHIFFLCSTRDPAGISGT